MCVAIEYKDVEGQSGVVVLAPPQRECLPVWGSGRLTWMRWGSINVGGDEIQIQRHGYGPLHFPDGGFVALEQLRAHAWIIYEPKPARIMASRFRMAYVRGRGKTFDVPTGAYIQGCVARIGDYRRLYVVRVPAPKDVAAELLDPHLWPRIITNGRTGHLDTKENGHG